MTKIDCPHCGGEINTKSENKKKSTGTVNPYGHPFPHAKLYNVKIAPRLLNPKGGAVVLIPNDDIRNYSISGKVPGK